MYSTKKNLCLICSSRFKKEIFPEAGTLKQILKTCSKYLHEAIITRSLKNYISLKSHSKLPFCQTCFDFAFELSQLTEQVDMFEKKISDLTVLFSLAVFHCQSMSKDNERPDEMINADVIQVNVSRLPKNRFFSGIRTEYTKNENEKEQTKEINTNNHRDFQLNEEETEYIKVECEETFAFSLTNDSKDSDNELSEEEANSSANDGSNQLYLKNAEMPSGRVSGNIRRSARAKPERARKNSQGSYQSSDRELSEPDENSEEEEKMKSSTDNPRPPQYGNDKKDTLVCNICYADFETKSILREHQREAHPEKAQFKCPTCGKAFMYKGTLKRHKGIHTGERNYPCSICQRRFRTGNDRNKHLRTHDTEKRFQCALCPKKLSSAYSLKIHTSLHTGKQFQCTTCGNTYSTPSGLQSHEKVHTDETPHKCLFCEMKFTNFNDKKNHQIICEFRNDELKTDSNTSRKFICSTCGKSFLHLVSLNRHKLIHSGERKFKCSICQRRFMTGIYYKRHLRSHSDEKPFECSLCPKKFKLSISLKFHTNLHKVDEITNTDDSNTNTNLSERQKEVYLETMQWKCPTCEKTFLSKGTLKRHQRIHTGEKEHECYICEKSFRTASDQNRHMRTHTNQEPFECSSCPKKFKCESSLKLHTNIHTGTLFQCVTCGKTYNSKAKLEFHEKAHTSETALKCSVCELTFAGIKDKKSHEKIHNGGKPYECSICNRKFTFPKERDVHEKRHTGDKPHICKVCGVAFSTSSQLEIHNEKAHKGDKPYKCLFCEATYSESRYRATHYRKRHPDEIV